MKRFTLSLPVALLLCQFQLSVNAAPSVNQLIDSWIEASGGKSALEKITSRKATGTITLSALSMAAKLTHVAKAPNKRLTTVELGTFGTSREGFDGTTAWSSQPGMPVTEKTGSELRRSSREAVFNPELKFKTLYSEFEVTGSATVGSRPAWVLKATTSDNEVETHYFDQENGRLLKKDMVIPTPQGESQAEIVFEDYRSLDGIQVSYRVRITSPPIIAMVMQFDSIKHNEPLSDSLFAKPTQ